MSRYVRERLRVDAAHLVLRTNLELRADPNPPTPARLREMLVETILSRWLPPFASCGTGAYVDIVDHRFEPSSGEIALYDRDVVPRALATPESREALLPIDAVLARIDVRDVLDRDVLANALVRADALHGMQSGTHAGGGPLLPPSILFAFGSDLEGSPDHELLRLLEVAQSLGLYHGGRSPALPSPIAALCVLGRGCWLHGRSVATDTVQWFRAVITDEGHDEVLTFVEALSNSCTRMHSRREGRPPETTLEGSLGAYLAAAGSSEPIEVHAPESTGTPGSEAPS